MGQMSIWFANELLKMSFNSDTYRQQWDYLTVAALLVEPVIETDAGMLTEPTDTNYVNFAVPNGDYRPKIKFNTANWIIGEYGEITNTRVVTFPIASNNWGLIVGYALIATSTTTPSFTPIVAGYSTIIDTPNINTGDQLQIPVGKIFFGIYDSQ